MEHLELISLLTPEMEKLGYIKIDEYSFTLPMKGFIIMSNVVRREKPARFDIIFAIAFTQTADPDAWKKDECIDAIIESTWYQLLLNSGESAAYLDKLFCHDRYETTATDIKENLPAIIDLFKRKIISSFEKWNNAAWLIENFEEEVYWKKLYLYKKVESCLQLIRQQIGLQILSGITIQE
ncbi:MAG: hypothetical protein ACJ751_12980 [Niastella sp.]|uniref:hypothetical protein n=1 Tax=Niastella sp. TaxID=1869183 RepID=UPI00389B1DE9